MGCGTSQQIIKNIEPLPSKIYERKQLIGVGNHGRVYRSIYEIDKKQYANKIIDQFRQGTSIANMRNNYSQLIARLQKLKHQKIVPYYHFQINDKEISIIMEICKQGTLKKYIQKNGVSSESFASNIIENILEGLDYLHRNGIIHKDLKSSNVLIFPKDQIKVSDYAIAELYDQRLSIKDKKKNRLNNQIDYYRAESLPYIAPQVIRNIEITEKSDVWSVGCILLQILTGKTPWIDCANNFEQTFKIISSGVVPPFLSDQMSFQCKSFLQGCLAVIPTQRLSIKQLLKHKFIRDHSKNNAIQTLYFEQQQFLNKKIQQTDRNDTKRTVKINKGPSELEYIQNSHRYSKQSIRNDKKQLYRINLKTKTQPFEQQFDEISESFKLLQYKLDSKRPQVISRQDIKPVIEDQKHTILINNKKVQIQPHRFRVKRMNEQLSNKIIHELDQWSSPLIQKQRHQTIVENKYRLKDLNSHANSNSYVQNSLSNRNKTESNYQDALDVQLKVKNIRVQTEPYSSQNFDKDYFKKPLRLLKKKLKQNKELNQYSRKLSQSNPHNMSASINKIQQFTGPSIDEQTQPLQYFQTSKIRVRTQTKRQQIVIDTQLARAERDRYINEQKLMKKMRQQEKTKWQDQLKKGSQILKAELGKYYYPNIKINLKN